MSECGNALKRAKYRIRVFNTINFKKSFHYNPFAYIHSEKDILKLVNCLIANTKGDQKGGDAFWEKAETLLYCALIGYIHYEAPEDEQNMNTLVELINAMDVREDDEDYKNPVDLMFDALEAVEPQHFAVRQYKKYKLAAGKTAKSILISCGARLAPFDIAEVREIMAYDELGLDTLGDRKSALFFIISDTDSTFNFLIAMAFTQLFNLLCEKADDVYGGRLPVHVRCLWDECANTGQVPQLEKLCVPVFAGAIPAKGALQGQRRNHHRQHGFGHFLRGPGENHPERHGGAVGQGKHRHLHHQRHQRDATELWHQLPKAGPGANDNGRTGNHAGRQVHFAAAGRPSLLLPQVRSDKAP